MIGSSRLTSILAAAVAVLMTIGGAVSTDFHVLDPIVGTPNPQSGIGRESRANADTDPAVRMPARISTTTSSPTGDAPLDQAERALAQQLQVLERDARFPRSNDARDTLYPFNVDVTDVSAENVAAIEKRAIEGSDGALGAFLGVAVHLPDYRERSHALLLLNAGRGSVLALSTLAERAAGGYGFDRPDGQVSVFFEFLAWATGKWSGSSLDADDTFVPSFSERWTREDCVRAVDRARAMVDQHDAFSGRLIDSIRFCEARRTHESDPSQE